MTHYTIAAIPTMYRGRQYRSRLEAKWAAFFDRIGWKHEYEPFDLNGWIPDFLLRGHWPRHNIPLNVLAEIKPITDFDVTVALKMMMFNGDAEVPTENLLLLGVSPSLFTDGRVTGVQLGWIVGVGSDDKVSCKDNRAIFKCFANPDGLVVDYAAEYFSVGGILTAYDSRFWPNVGSNKDYRADLLEGPQSREFADEIMDCWADASNSVQWRGKGVRS